MGEYYKARVISHPQVKENDVNFWCMVNGNMYRCHSKEEKGKRDLVFILPGQVLLIYRVNKLEVLFSGMIPICKNLYLDSTRIQIKRG